MSCWSVWVVLSCGDSAILKVWEALDEETDNDEFIVSVDNYVIATVTYFNCNVVAGAYFFCFGCRDRALATLGRVSAINLSLYLLG